MIRQATPDDAAAVAAIYRPYVDSTVITFEVSAPDETEMRSRIAGTTGRYPYTHHEFHRRGIGRRLYDALLPRLVQQQFVNAYAGITLSNAGSVGLHEAVGFTPVGVYRNVGFKLGRWHDVGWWHLQLRPLPPTPREPLLPRDVEV